MGEERGISNQACAIGSGLDQRTEWLMKVEVERTRCEGHAMCEAVAPAYFSVDEDGVLTILAEEVPESEKYQVDSAVLSCPVAALRLRSG